MDFYKIVRQAAQMLQQQGKRTYRTLRYRQIRLVEQARTELSTAIEMYCDMGMTFWVTETEAVIAAVES